MIGYQFQYTNSINSESIIFNDYTTDPQNFFTIQESPEFVLGIVHDERKKEGQHGIFDTNSWYDKRAISFTGKIVAESRSKMLELSNKMIKVFALPIQPESIEDGYNELKFTDEDGDEWFTMAKVQEYPKFTEILAFPYVRDFLILLKAKDVNVYSTIEHTELFGFTYYTGSLKLPTKLPAKFLPIYHNVTTITNAGNSDAPCIIRIYGDAYNPKILNETVNKFVRLATITILSTDYIDIDMNNGTVIKNGTIDVSGYVTADSKFFFLKPGANIIRYTDDNPIPIFSWTTPTAHGTITYRDTKI